MIGILGGVLARRVGAIAVQAALSAAVATAVSTGLISADAVCSVATF